MDFKSRKPHRSSKARSAIIDITKAFLDRSSVDAIFPDRSNSMVVRIDPGEVVTAVFCGIDPQTPEQVKNLT
ncbi:hypothetical protein BGZ65_001828, partial [Modicella reniformis]